MFAITSSIHIIIQYKDGYWWHDLIEKAKTSQYDAQIYNYATGRTFHGEISKLISHATAVKLTVLYWLK